MQYDVIVIGGGLSGLAAASLLAKRGLHVAVVDKSYNPGGSCGTFKRDDTTFDQGSAMLFGFGENGFNAHRFAFNCLEEPIDVIKHDLLYCVNFKGHRIRFWDDIDQFAAELAAVFPSEEKAIGRFYRDLNKMYQHVIVENQTYTTPDETDKQNSLKGLLRHPISYIRFLGYLNKSAKVLLDKYFKDPEIIKFFDKLTSTYCYATVEESPAVLASVMFVDNHVGGSYYPAGSTVFLPGKLEKVIEECGGEMIMGREVVSILFEEDKPVGVALDNGEKLFGKDFVYSGTVWNLYEKLIDTKHTTPERRNWSANQVSTYPSVVLYAAVDREIIPDDTAPIEMLVGNPDQLDESEVTVYIMSIDDRSICKDDEHTVIAIGPTFDDWNMENRTDYAERKEQEKERLISVLEKRFPGFRDKIRFTEVATPRTIERYTNKNRGAVAGPKQMLGQHMFHRLHTRSEWDNLFCCGESTILGTGTPTVTTTGISAANAILRKVGSKPFEYDPDRKNYVRILPHPYTSEQLYSDEPEERRQIQKKSSACQFCEHPTCARPEKLDVRGIMRRLTVGNFVGAKRIAERQQVEAMLGNGELIKMEEQCIQNIRHGKPVEIQAVLGGLMK